jgi:hypothetical protein
VEMFRQGGIGLLGYQFDLFYDFSIGLWWKCSDGVVFVCKGINFDPFYDFSIRLWLKCSDRVVFVS